MSEQNKISRGFLLLFSLSLLLAACGEAGIDVNVPAEVMAEQPTLIPTETSIPTPTEIPAPEYPLVPNIEDFRESYIPVEELLDGSYWNWLNEVVAPTLVADFEARRDQIRDDIPLSVIGLQSGSAFFYDDDGVYENEEETAPWERNVTFATTETLDPITNTTLEYMILPVFYYDKEQHKVFPVVTVMPIFHPELVEESIKVYSEDMSMPVIIYSESSGAFGEDNIKITPTNDPLVAKIYEKLGSKRVWEMTEAFAKGNMSAFSSPDVVVGATIVSSKFFK